MSPSAFVSYSWDSERHKEWVCALATRLRLDGVDVTLDKWDTAPGDQIPAFMEKAIRDNDFVIVVCTERYKQRSDARQGGVGYEGDIMTAEVVANRNRRKFIPVWRSGAWPDAAPSWLAGSSSPMNPTPWLSTRIFFAPCLVRGRLRHHSAALQLQYRDPVTQPWLTLTL